MARQIRIDGDIAYVPLTKGLEAIIDACDVPLVAPFNWYAKVRHGTTSYAAFNRMDESGVRVRVLMHRLLANTPEGLNADHRDGNGLNNRRSNLRNATQSQNMHNARLRIDNTSGFKGVCWHPHKAKWQARIRLNGKQNHLGYHDTKDSAYEAYCQAAKQLHGDFARLS